MEWGGKMYMLDVTYKEDFTTKEYLWIFMKLQYCMKIMCQTRKQLILINMNMIISIILLLKVFFHFDMSRTSILKNSHKIWEKHEEI